MRSIAIAGWLFILGLMILIGGCITTKTPHENFKTRMNYSVGKKADDLRTSIGRYPENVRGKTILINGNAEIQYFRGVDCTVFFEVDSKSNVIVNWRFEGTEKTCRIAP